MGGEGHWDAWLKREIQKRSEENKQRGLLGKKGRNKRKKKGGDNKENILTKPNWFDIEPFYTSMQMFIKSNLETRK